jgi:putative SOS response-associated peptidase YedK
MDELRLSRIAARTRFSLFANGRVTGDSEMNFSTDDFKKPGEALELNGHTRLFQNLAPRRSFGRFTKLNLASWQAPQTPTQRVAAFHEQHLTPAKHSGRSSENGPWIRHARKPILKPMCSLYSMRRAAEEARKLAGYLEEPDFPPRDRINPGEPIAIVRAGLDGQRHFALVRWGFVPSWAKEIQPGRPLINARSETVYEKASFKNAIRRRRCLILADGFYEWQDVGAKRKQAWFVHRPDHALFAFGGIWEHWMAPDGSELETAAMLTAMPNLPLSAVHDRSPVVIMPENFARWLSSDEQVQDLLKAPPEDFWVMEKVASPRSKPPPPTPAPQPKQQMDML